MITAKLILDKRSRGKKGHPIKIMVTGYGRQKRISTGKYSEAKDWGNGPLKSHPQGVNIRRWYKDKDFELLRAVNYCNRNALGFEASVQTIKTGIDDPQVRIESLREQIRELSSGPSLFTFWDQFCRDRKAEGKSIRPFELTLAQIKNYTGDILLSEITYEFLSGFVRHKYQSGTGQAGVSYYLRQLRTVYLEAQRRESISLPPGNPFKGLIPSATKKRRPERITREHMAELEAYLGAVSGSRGESVRRRIAVFLFQLYIGGHDFVEVASLKWADISEGRVQFYRQKMRNREGEWIDNAILPPARAILEAYGTPERERVFHFLPLPEHETTYNNYRNNTNRTLKGVSDRLSIPMLKTKSPRYIFRSWAGEIGADLLATMQLQGHKPRGVSFLYQGRLPNKIVDKVHREILGL